MDVKAAFLQGNAIERTVYVWPPKEVTTNKIWLLKKCIYGLADASRYWYLKLREEFIKLNATMCKLDQGIFLWFEEGNLVGIIVCFVDDVLWAGTPSFKLSVIDRIKQIFAISSENSQTFTYIGIEIHQKEDGTIIINQRNYINSISLIPITKERLSNPHDCISDKERTLFRAAIGQLNWLAAGISYPEISFDVCEASTRVPIATIADLKAILNFS